MHRFVTILTLGCFCCSIALCQKLNVTYGHYAVKGGVIADSGIIALLIPYKDSINKTMNTVIGFSTEGLTKKQPESGLGNFMTDAMRLMAEKQFKTHVHAAFINYGGVRSYLPKGDITVGKMFELMPFENVLILQDVKGDSLQSFLNAIAERNGWPISGITFGIKDKIANNILVEGKPLDTAATYTIANSDYIVNGGDNLKILKSFQQKNIGYLLRDALIGYAKLLTEKGQSIDAKTEKRITYAR